ncbi:MAG TPA: HNH endonuclease [Patescibacteria group bacterium]|nr:HNH endonuclease [Patescibacteria group bacterium]
MRAGARGSCNPPVRTRTWSRLLLVTTFGGQCAYCARGAPLHADHRIPLARGGSNSIDNIVPACSSCNLRKGTLTEAEFRARLDGEKDQPPRYT